MPHRIAKPRGTIRLSALAAMIVLAACGNNPVEPGDHDEPEAMVILLGGTPLVTVDEDRNVTGSLSVQLGEQTEELTVTFLDHDGDPVIPESGYHLEVLAANPAIAEFLQDPAGAFSGRIQGNAAGTTTLTFRYMHGPVGSGHADYESPPITVQVTD